MKFWVKDWVYKFCKSCSVKMYAIWDRKHWKLEIIFNMKIFERPSLFLITFTDLGSSSKYYGLWFSYFSLVSFTRSSKGSEKLHICRVVVSVVSIFIFLITHSWIRGKQELKRAIEKKNQLCSEVCDKRDLGID